MQRYLILIKSTPTGYSVWSPALPGCVATAQSRVDIENVMRNAIEFHLDGLRADGRPVPPPTTSASYVEVAA
jgi:predicted RNase H-like HicB family nuclease